MKPSLKPVHDQVMVLTGATSGIGLATARKAAVRGARLVIAARNVEALREIADELNTFGAETVTVVADVANEADVRHIGAAAVDRFGGFDTWMNIAGVGIFGKNEEVSVDDMRRLFDINFWGVVYGSLTAVRHLKHRGGALINVGSETSDRAVPLQGIYSASKHAVKGFTDSLRVELEEEGAPISITLIKPASIDTMFVAHARNYLEVEPRLPPPIYAPDIVADALLYAAEHPIRDFHVGGRSRLMQIGAHYLPRAVDKGMQHFMYRYIKSDRPPRDRADNNLYRPARDLQERAGVGGRTHETSYYTTAVMHPAATRAAILGAGLACVVMWRARRK